MDDSIVFCKTKEEAIERLKKIKVFLKEKLELELNEKTQVFKDTQGINFCGYQINPYRIKIKPNNKRNLKKVEKEYKKAIKYGIIESKEFITKEIINNYKTPTSFKIFKIAS